MKLRLLAQLATAPSLARALAEAAKLRRELEAEIPPSPPPEREETLEEIVARLSPGIPLYAPGDPRNEKGGSPSAAAPSERAFRYLPCSSSH